MKATNKLKALLVLAPLAAVSACGAMQPKKDADTAQISSVPPQGLPQSAIIAVPVNERGEEQSDSAQMRLVPTAPADIQGSGIATAFQSANAPDQVSELDSSTSTQSFHGWQNYRRPYSYSQNYVYNYGNNYGHNNRGSHCGYQTYSPTYYYGGTPYSWQYQNNYQTSSMNYYHYQMQNWNQYSGSQYGYNQSGYQIQPIGYRY